MPPPGGAERARDRVYDAEEIRKLWVAFDGPVGQIYRLVLVTGQRSGEVAGMKWSELDNATWTVPAARMKSKRVSPDAQELFDAWRADLEARLRTPEMEACPAFESHLSKYRSLMPSLALIFHLTETVSSVSSSAVGFGSVKAAAAWCQFLEAHARKIYAAEMNADVSAAHALAAKIEAGAVEDGGSVRDLYRPQWSGLRTPEAVYEGLMVLQKLGWLRIEERETGARKADVVLLSPKLRKVKP